MTSVTSASAFSAQELDLQMRISGPSSMATRNDRPYLVDDDPPAVVHDAESAYRLIVEWSPPAERERLARLLLEIATPRAR